MMRATCKSLIVVCTVAAVGLGLAALNAPRVGAADDVSLSSGMEVGKLRRLLKEGEVVHRREAARELMDIVAADGIDVAELIPILEHALKDDNSQVRAIAAGTAAGLALARGTGGDPQDALFDKDEVLEPWLISLVSDSSADVRDSAVMALSFGYKPSERIQQTVSKQFTEETNVKVRNSIVGLIELHGYTNKQAKNLLVHALSDCHGSVRQAAASYLKKWATQATFDALVTAYHKEGAASTR